MASEPTTAELLKRLRDAGGNAWDGVLDVRAELADMRGTDEADDDDHLSVMELIGLFKDSPEKFGEGLSEEGWS